MTEATKKERPAWATKVGDLLTDSRGIKPGDPKLEILLTPKKERKRLDLTKLLTQSLDPADKSEEKQG